MGPLTQRLVDTLGEIAAVLEADGETHWRTWAITARSRLQDSDFSGITYVLGAYGGMGSFSDLVVGQTSQDGKLALKADAKVQNERLTVLRERAWTLATSVERGYESAGT
jgi:hypothetical protein